MIHITYFFDIICPWCYIGKYHIEQAFAQRPMLSYSIDYRIFQLNPDMPLCGMDRQAYLTQKFGDRAVSFYDYIDKTGKSCGLDFALDKIAFTPNSMAGHILVYYMQEKNPNKANDFVDDLFNAYFCQAIDFTDNENLLNIAANYDDDIDKMRALLHDEHYRDELQQQDRQMRINFISGVPLSVINNQYVVNGAQDAAALLPLIDMAAKDIKEEN